MPVFRRLIVGIERLLIFFFALLCILMPLELIQAWNSPPCSTRVEPGDDPLATVCYPWGSLSPQGPFAGGSWNYLSRENYLASGLFMLIVLATGLALAFWLRPRRRIVGLLAALGMLKVGAYFLPLVFSRL